MTLPFEGVCFVGLYKQDVRTLSKEVSLGFFATQADAVNACLAYFSVEDVVAMSVRRAA